jgi:hypothetical protein
MLRETLFGSHIYILSYILLSRFVILVFIVLNNLLWSWHFAMQEKPLLLVSQEGYCISLLHLQPFNIEDVQCRHPVRSHSTVNRLYRLAVKVDRLWVVLEFNQLKNLLFVLRIFVRISFGLMFFVL